MVPVKLGVATRGRQTPSDIRLLYPGTRRQSKTLPLSRTEQEHSKDHQNGYKSFHSVIMEGEWWNWKNWGWVEYVLNNPCSFSSRILGQGLVLFLYEEKTFVEQVF